MKRGVRKKEGEDLSEANIEKVSTLLNQEKPITKKEACSILNISYNPARLNKIIEEHNDLLEYRARRRKELRNAPLSDDEISEIISTYLETGNLSEIADSTFRSTDVIKRVLEKYNIPLRSTEYDYFNPPILNEESVKNDYAKEDLVYSARYTQPAKVSKRYNEEVYRIWLLADEQYALQPYWELGDLREIQTSFGIDTPDRKYWSGEQEILRAINLALQNQKRRKSKSE
jgi:hypothetical protein